MRREEREKKCQPHSSAERNSSASARSIADPLLEGPSEVSPHPKAAEVTERGCSPAISAERVTTSGTEDSSAQTCVGQPDPPAAKLKAQFRPGEEIPTQKTECSARLPRGARHLESAASHCCGLENRRLAQLHFKVELWRALGARENELLKTGHTVPLHLPSKFSLSVFATSKVIPLPTQRESRAVVSKDDEHLVGLPRAHLAQGAAQKAVSLP